MDVLRPQIEYFFVEALRNFLSQEMESCQCSIAGRDEVSLLDFDETSFVNRY